MTRPPPPSLLRRALFCTCLALAGNGAAADPAAAAWASLTPAQQQALAPLQQDWPNIDAQRRSKWLEVAARFPGMPPDERQRLMQRMIEWARLSPAERAQARLQFQQAQSISPEERQARWEAYQALPPEERSKLAQRNKPATAPAATESDIGKRNIVSAKPPSPVRAVAPTVVQAQPGATTTIMTTKAAPPPHHQPGMPKIVATPGFVDPATLLPKRGPQGAAVRSAASGANAAQR